MKSFIKIGPGFNNARYVIARINHRSSKMWLIN